MGLFSALFSFPAFSFPPQPVSLSPFSLLMVHMTIFAFLQFVDFPLLDDWEYPMKSNCDIGLKAKRERNCATASGWDLEICLECVKKKKNFFSIDLTSISEGISWIIFHFYKCFCLRLSDFVHFINDDGSKQAITRFLIMECN